MNRQSLGLMRMQQYPDPQSSMELSQAVPEREKSTHQDRASAKLGEEGLLCK